MKNVYSLCHLPSQNEIRMVHEASVSGNLEAIAHKEYRQSVYTARDTNGISAFHKVNKLQHLSDVLRH